MIQGVTSGQLFGRGRVMSRREMKREGEEEEGRSRRE